MSKSKKNLFDRRNFLKTAAAGGVATLAVSATPLAAQQAATPAPAKLPAMPKESDPTGIEVMTEDRPGSDFMVDVIKALGFEYVAANPGSSFRALHESLINYGGNKPEFITCCHEESSMGIAHGYANVEGKPLLTLAHSTVGLQHAAMGIYNAWAGRAPIYIMLGNTLDETMRRPGVEWYHSAVDAAAMVRDFTKWDDTPISLAHYAESAARAYKVAMTLPMAPVVLVLDSDLQEKGIPKDANLRIPKVTLDTHPQADSGSIAETARLLVAAKNPVVVVGRVVRSQEGMQRLVEFAEALQVPIIDQGNNMPSRHPLNQGGGAAMVRNADVILGLEVENLWSVVHSYRDQQERSSSTNTQNGVKLVSIGVKDVYIKANYQNFQRYQEVDLSMAADPETTLPALTEAVNRLLTPAQKSQNQERGKKLADAKQKAYERARSEAVYGWDSSPISLPRLSAEVWAQVKNEDWAGGMPGFQWNYEKYHHAMHGGSAAGEGGGLPTAVGAALAHRKNGRLFVHLQPDGDLMYAPGALWTAAHSKIPLLMVMHNNRAYHQEVMHIQRMANRHQRDIMNTAGIGTTLTDPNIDYAKLAQSMGVYSEGPISNPKDLAPAIKRAVAVVKRGEPALIDTLTQPR